MTYDDLGFLATVADARTPTNETAFTFDDRGRVTTITNQLGETTELTYSGPNDSSTADDPQNWGGGTFLTRVEVGRTQADDEGQVRIFRYDNRGHLVRVERKSAPAAAPTTFVSFTNDTAGNRLRSSDAETREFDFVYDNLDRLVSVTDEASAETSFEYDAFDNRITMTDALDQVSQFAFDGLDRLSTVTVEGASQELSLVTAFEYDARGNLERVIDPRLNETVYAYDLLSRLQSVTPHLGSAHTVSYCYDGRGRLKGSVNARNQRLHYEYAAWGGLESVRYPASGACGDTVAGSPRQVSYSYDENGNLLTVGDDAIQAGDLYTFTWDELNRVDKVEVHYLPGAVVTPALDVGYDRFGNRSALDYEEGGATVDSHSWDFGFLNRLNSATLKGSQLTFDYYDNDELETIHHANSVVTTYVYKAHGPLQSISVDASSQLHHLDYVLHDANGNLKTLRESINATLQTPDYTYDYDGASRLTDAAYPTGLGLVSSEIFPYDDAGNRDDDDSTSSPWAYDGNDRILASPSTGASDVSYAFDDDGNMISRNDNGHTLTLTWDANNRLEQAVDSIAGTADYVYDPFGRRIRKEFDPTGPAGPETTWYLWDGDQLLGELDGSGVRQVRYAYAGGFAPSQVAYNNGVGGEDLYEVHTDHLDTPRMLTDASDVPVWRASYEAFGEVPAAALLEDPDGDSNSLTFNIRFPGQYFDAETGLHYNRFRYYDPGVGRYISADPLGQAGGANVYSYVLNNPLNVLDPLGLLGEVICTRCKGSGGPMECAVLEDGKEKFSFTSNAGTNEPSRTPGDEFGSFGPLPPGKFDLPNAKSPKFGRRLPSPTNTGTPGNVRSPKGTLKEGIRIHEGSLSQGCITCGTGVPGRKIEDAITDLVDRNANSGGTTLEIREKDCGKEPCQ